MAYERFPILAERRKQPAGAAVGRRAADAQPGAHAGRTAGVLIADEPTLGLAPLAAVDDHGAIPELRDVGCAMLL